LIDEESERGGRKRCVCIQNGSFTPLIEIYNKKSEGGRERKGMT
jgi:hypothetical protein